MPDVDSARSEPDSDERRHVFREFVSSALYMALVLMAVLVALPDDRVPDGWAVLGLLMGTAVGLTLAHWVAFRLAARVADGSGIPPVSAAREAGALVAGGAVAALVASVPLVLLDGEQAVTVSLLLLAALPALAGMAIGRLRGRSWVRSVIAGAIVLAIALVVVAVKALLGGH